MNARSLQHEGRNGTAPPPAEPIENRVLGMLAELSQSLAALMLAFGAVWRRRRR